MSTASVIAGASTFVSKTHDSMQAHLMACDKPALLLQGHQQEAHILLHLDEVNEAFYRLSHDRLIPLQDRIFQKYQ